MNELNQNAIAIRPMRIILGKLRTYESFTFPKNPWAGCEVNLRRLEAFGYLQDDGNDCLIDILDDNGDIIQDYPVTKKGFEYLRKKLRFRLLDSGLGQEVKKETA